MALFRKTAKVQQKPTDISDNQNNSDDLNNSEGKQNYANGDFIPQIIALTLLFAFVLTILVLFLANIKAKSFLDKPDDMDFRKGWFELLKNALVLLSTALTTVIGYYFGQRSGQIESNNAKLQAEKNVQQAVDYAKSVYEGRNKEAIRTGVSDDSANDTLNITGSITDIVEP